MYLNPLRDSDIPMNPSNRCDQFLIPKGLLYTGEAIGMRPMHVSAHTLMEGVALLEAHQYNRQRLPVRPNQVEKCEFFLYWERIDIQNHDIHRMNVRSCVFQRSLKRHCIAVSTQHLSQYSPQYYIGFD